MKNADLELLRSLWMPHSHVIDENCPQSLKVWLTDGNYYLNNNPPSLSIFVNNSEDFKKSISVDAFRLTMHAAQTLFELEKASAYLKFTSWQVIQTYYAAFFAAHALLRFFGKSFSHLESGHVNFLKQRCASEAGYTPDIPSTYYLIEYNAFDNNISFNRFGESHKDLWKCFNTLIKDISNSALTLRASEQRKQNLSQIFASMSEAICCRCRYQGGNWLSVKRNDVNYKSMHGVWFPFSKSVPNFNAIFRKMRDWRHCNIIYEDPNNIKNEIEKFFSTSISIVDLALSIATDYQFISKKPGKRSGDFSRLIRISAT